MAAVKRIKSWAAYEKSDGSIERDAGWGAVTNWPGGGVAAPFRDRDRAQQVISNFNSITKGKFVAAEVIVQMKGKKAFVVVEPMAGKDYAADLAKSRDYLVKAGGGGL